MKQEIEIDILELEHEELLSLNFVNQSSYICSAEFKPIQTNQRFNIIVNFGGIVSKESRNLSIDFNLLLYLQKKRWIKIWPENTLQSNTQFI